ncbi:MAG TPA: isochorismatase family protein [Desulfobacterales bacterium]|jgi:nicotinamidase-related amidase|nr:isochorismatase family protein [Desulfobacterales bacterium]
MVQTTSWLKLLEDYNFRQARPVPEKTALLVIDMQNYFRVLAGPVLSNVLSLIEACRSRGIRIVFTRHGHREPARDGGMLRTWWGDLIMFGSPEWQLMQELDPSRGEAVIDKTRYSAFFKTSLDEQLRAGRVEDLIVCGVMTNCCCETTARSAFVRDYRVFFVADATATANQELQLATLKNLAYGFAYIAATEELCQHLCHLCVCD